MYQHSQAGSVMRVTILIAICILLLLGWATLQTPHKSGVLTPERQDVLLRLLGVMFLLLVILAFFHNLTVSVDQEFVQLAFGVGIVHRKIPLNELTSCKVVTNQWWWGFGIRKIPGGWMWNVSGLKAVELRRKNGRMFRVGTDEPEALAAVIQERLAACSG